MSTRLSLPLFAPFADIAELPVWFGSTELCRRLGLTARQLQWWDEQGLLPARHEGHKRLYSGRDAVLAGVIGIVPIKNVIAEGNQSLRGTEVTRLRPRYERDARPSRNRFEFSGQTAKPVLAYPHTGGLH
jgi:hypothetical protein